MRRDVVAWADELRRMCGGEGDAPSWEIVGPAGELPSVYDVNGFATATVAAASLSLAELHAARSGGPTVEVRVDPSSAAAAFFAETSFRADGWERPAIWDPVAGDYRSADRWIRLHTNERRHRDAVLGVLGVPVDAEAVATAVARWRAADLEEAVVAAGGVAATMWSAEEWAAHPQGRMVAGEVSVEVVRAQAASTLPSPGEAPLAGVRVLDLTRVVAGPTCTGFLAAYGADVVRIDPPGFQDVPALLPLTTAGKRCAALDLRTAGGRDRFATLIEQAHVLVTGLRPGALDDLGWDSAALVARNPSLHMVRVDAYGWDGPWAGRRGFDSIVQMSCGIAARGAEVAESDRPTPLPVQALDFGAGYLLAAATCQALLDGLRHGRRSEVRASLAGMARLLVAAGEVGEPGPRPTAADEHLVAVDTAWGRGRRVPQPATLAGIVMPPLHPAGPLGSAPAAFATGATA